MNRKLSALCALTGVALLAPTSFAALIFGDDFESGTLNNWTTTVATALVIDNTQNVVPAGGSFSAKMAVSTARMHHNMIADNGGVEVSGASYFTSWIYDDGVNSGTTGATRVFNEVRGYAAGTGLPNGGTTANGSLSQLLAIGKYNAVTLTGEVFNGSKYQGRSISGVNGWFNLDGPGSPNRSVGWHKFTIERLADDTTINYYVDDILSRTITGTGVQSWDTLVMGPGLGTQVGDSWIDGIEVASGLVPEPGTAGLLAVAGAAFLARRRSD